MTDEKLAVMKMELESFKESELYEFITTTLKEKYDGMLAEAGNMTHINPIRSYDRAYQLQEDLNFITNPF